MKDRHDLVVIGGGSAGLTGARFAARLGARVALVEKQRVGGDCTWTGCVPSKALIHVARVAHDARHGHALGVRADPSIDMAAVRDHVNRAVGDVYKAEHPEVLAGEGVEVIQAPARFTAPLEIEAGDRVLRPRAAIIATGATAWAPPIPGLDAVEYMTHETIFDNDRLPDHLLVIGAGPIGVELAQAYRRLGSRVSMAAVDLLPIEDDEVREAVRVLLEREGIELHLGPIKSVGREGGAYRIELSDGTLAGDLLLVATGRRPNMEGLGLAAAGITHGPKGIPVDRFLRTNVRQVYAAGDVIGGPQLTHLAGWQSFQAARNALLPGKEAGHPAVLPRVIFVDPEVASVGLTESEARMRHGDTVRVHRWPMAEVDRAITEDRPEGFAKVLADRKGRILGASIVASRAGELIAEFVLAMENGLGLSHISRALHAYPTWSTAVQQLASEEATDRFLSSAVGRLVRKMAGL